MMEAVRPFDEVMDEVVKEGGESLNLCYQCGMCSGMCPWGVVRDFNLRKMLRMVQLGLVEESDDIWLCTTCKACVDRCPRGVELIDVIRSMRRMLVGGGMIPQMQRSAISNMVQEGNPWGNPAEERMDWAKGLDVRAYERGMDWLLFVGCAPSYDPRNQKVAKALVEVLNSAGVEFGVLGNEEKCCGDSARRIGDEQAFGTLAERNVAKFEEMGVERVVAISPHTFHTLKNDYGEFGGELEVVHHTQLLAELVDEGKLVPGRLERKVTYHDPCYLGRHNGVYEEPRKVLESIPGLELVEMERNREFSLCCGGGGGRFWTETVAEERFSNLRVEEALGTGVDTILTACPFCILNFEDSTKAMNKEGSISTIDIAEVLTDST
ncbi:MAG: (Fe-S)-binding protein [Thermoplasmata archaeon]|nr:(Fe-S)-binding protein [Thermoplasmata archaeon]